MIIAKNVTKTYKQGTKTIHAVENVNLRVTKGERVYIHGPSGAGKSTLLHILGGLSVPSDGSVAVGEKDIYNMSDRQRSFLRNKRFGFIFQFYHLLPELDILENVMLPAMIAGGERRKKIRERAAQFLEDVNMTDRLTHKPSQLSGGEAQRVAIARALINSPEILFCDEPAGNLDSAMAEEIYALIRNISEANNMSVVVISHQGVNEGFANTEYAMTDGIMEKTEVRRLQI